MFVSGKVQGVFYRASARTKAKELDLLGWIRNLPDGQVEIMIEGNEGNIRKFTEWCKKGPINSHVRNLEIISKTKIERYSTGKLEIY